MKIGFVGQGWIGKHYADDFESRGFDVVRYALEAPYVDNKAKIADCDIVFIAVPTPTTPTGFSDVAVRDALSTVGTGKIAVLKSTLLPGTTEVLQHAFPTVMVLHSPEFLTEATAAYDAAHPTRNIIGVVHEDARSKAELVLSVLPASPYSAILPVREAELIKYAGNCFLATKVIFMNLFYDYAAAHGADWERLREALVADPRIGASHTMPIHASGRGAGGHCFIKDFEAWRQDYAKQVHDHYGDAVLQALVEKNLDLLAASGKDEAIVAGVYGKPPVSIS